MDAARSVTGPSQPPTPPAPLPAGCSCLPKTSSTSLTKSFTAVHDFRVTDYSLLEGMGFGRYVSSSTFSVGGRDWAIRFYPDGATVGLLGDTSAFLYYYSRDRDAPVARARFTLNLLEKDGKMPSVTNPYMKHTFSPASDNWGFTKFMEKSRLQQGSPYLDRDCLTIRELLKLYLSIGECCGCHCLEISLEGGGSGMCCTCHCWPGTRVLHSGPRQDYRDGQEATKVSCECVGLCFQ